MEASAGACKELHDRTSSLSAHVHRVTSSHRWGHPAHCGDRLAGDRGERQRVEAAVTSEGTRRAISQALEDDDTIKGINGRTAQTSLNAAVAVFEPAAYVIDVVEQLLEAYLGHVRTANASLEMAAFNVAGQEKMELSMPDQVRNRCSK